MSEVWDRTGKFLTAKDGRIVPLKMGGYTIDSHESDLVAHCFGLECITFPFRIGIPGGGGNPCEGVKGMTLREKGEETGFCNTRIAHSRVINFLSLNAPMGRSILADREKPVVGPEYISRNVLRTVSDSPPVQQPAKEGENYPEFLVPRYRVINPFAINAFNPRASTATALHEAERLGMLYEVETTTEEASLDDDKLAEDMDKSLYHPDIIRFYCTDDADIHRRAANWENLEKNDPLGSLFRSMEYSGRVVHKILGQTLPHDSLIRSEMAQAMETN